jgi:hypothetical protein
MEFEWDETKNEANRLKHGFGFATASRISGSMGRCGGRLIGGHGESGGS